MFTIMLGTFFCTPFANLCAKQAIIFYKTTVSNHVFYAYLACLYALQTASWAVVFTLFTNHKGKTILTIYKTLLTGLYARFVVSYHFLFVFNKVDK